MAELLSQSMEQPNIRHDAPPQCCSCRISVIVPVGPNDDSWKSLVPSLSHLTDNAEICLVGASPAPVDLPALLGRHGVHTETRWIVSSPGRAVQMNEGARYAKGDFFWFLHADSKFGVSAFTKLLAALDADPAALHYFDLTFDRSSFEWVLLNEWGVRLRSRLLRLPFGDQGLCLHRQLFNTLGPFDQTVPYGEDHLLVWSCHRRGTKVRPIRATLSTSARKYRERGWLRTTFLHGWRTWRQALPQLWHLVRGRQR